MEDAAVTAVFGPGMACSSTKGWSGHTLGACGILGALIAGLAIEHGFLPGCLGMREPDPAFSQPRAGGNGAPPRPPGGGELVRLRRHQLHAAAGFARVRPVRIAGIGLLGPGLPGWAASRAVLTGAEPWRHGEVALPPPAILPATERRRTGPVARLALAVATEAAAASGLPAASLRPVFGSGNGDSITVGGILDALTRPDGFVSPTQFHNSVHNAAAGVLVDRHRVQPPRHLPRRP